MKKTIYIVTLFLIFSKSFCQEINIAFKINNQIAIDNIGNFRIRFEDDKKAKLFETKYENGRLILNEQAISIIKADTLNKFYLVFHYTTLKKNKAEIVEFEIELTPYLIKQPRLVANIYDFRDKKYKHWYQWHTKKSYLVDFDCYGCGKYIRQQ